MFDQIAKVVARFEEIERQMVDPQITSDHRKLTELAQERSDLKPLFDAHNRYLQVVADMADANEMIQLETEREMIQFMNDELKALESEKETLEFQMRRLLVPKDPRDNKSVYIEIRAGAGGDEAAIFAADLLRMYMRYAETRGWKPYIMDENFIGLGGYKEVIVAVKGAGAYSRLKYESGVHRVQRVPVTESQGRIHTSTATVAVMPEIDNVEVSLNMNDLEITATFSSGPGGQHMQKNATAARVVHKPSGIMVKVQSERSLTQNKQLAFQIIQARLQEMEEAAQNAEVAAERKSQVGTGERSEKIRTYNYPQSRVTDHRLGYSSYNLSAVIDGDLDQFIDRLIIADETEKLAAAGL
ncbi:MAG: peptide chain release factor 1 [Ardenticatenaceae bacterium]|nr:peptide chain release factor 1 [Ardenticatenaceae bacterium]